MVPWSSTTGCGLSLVATQAALLIREVVVPTALLSDCGEVTIDDVVVCAALVGENIGVAIEAVLTSATVAMETKVEDGKPLFKRLSEGSKCGAFRIMDTA